MQTHTGARDSIPIQKTVTPDRVAGSTSDSSRWCDACLISGPSRKRHDTGPV